MKFKKLCLSLLIAFLAVAAASADLMLPFYDFDFDAYIDTYNQLIVNDVYYGEDERPYYSSLETALSVFSRNLDRKALAEKVRENDADALKSYIRNEIDNGEKISDQEIYELLFDPDSMYSAYVAPTTDSPMSFFGHNFLMFYLPDAPMLSPCINFYAHYEHLSGFGTVIEGLKGTLESYYDFKPFHVTFLDYTATRDRSISMSPMNMEVGKERLLKILSELSSGTYHEYSFLWHNCSHGFMDLLHSLDEDIVFNEDRALSPAMGIRMFSEKGLVGKPGFEFPAWNDAVTSRASSSYKPYYRSIASGETGFTAEPFENLPLTRDVRTRRETVSSRFSSLSFRYDLDDQLNHRMELWFKPVFNDYVEQNYVDHEIINLKVLSGGVSARVTNENRFEFEGFEVELLSFDSIFPFTTLKKRPSFGASISLGMRDYMFLAETEFYGGMSLGNTDFFWFFGLDNVASTAPLLYTLNFRNMFGGVLGPVSYTNTTDMVLFSTLHEYFHIENNLDLRIRIVDSLTLGLNYRLWTEGEITNPVLRQSGGVNLIWNFNIF